MALSKLVTKAIKDAEKGTGADAEGQSVNTMNVTATTVYVNGNVVVGGTEDGKPAGLSGWDQMKPGTGERESAFAKAARRKRIGALEEIDTAAILAGKKG